MGPHPGRFGGMADDAVLGEAAAALQEAAAAQPGSWQRRTALAAYDRAKAELDRRTVRNVLARIAEAEGQEGQ